MTTDSSELAGRTALVTGATSGIGRATALALSAAGAEVLVHGRDLRRGIQVVEQIEQSGGTARFVRADLADPDEAIRLAEEAGDVDILVNNAGFSWFGPSEDLDSSTLARLFASNVESAYLLTSHLAPAMAARGEGSIINLSSMAATVGLAGGAAYSATKAALSALTRAWAAEFSPRGVRVNAVAPGPVYTAGADGGRIAALGRSTLLGIATQPEAIAEAIEFLASPRSAYITGAVLPVDGGRTAICAPERPPSRDEYSMSTSMPLDLAATTPTRFVEHDGIRHAYRRLNEGTGVPVLLTNHFMGNLDTVDPAVVDGLAATRDVVWFDSVGVGASTGEPRSTIAAIADDAVEFARALGLRRFDLLGHSMGGQVAQMVALTHPELVRRLILVGTGPRGGEPTDPADGTAALFAAGPNLDDELWLPIFFPASDSGQAAGRRYVQRIRARIDRDLPFSPAAVSAYSAARVEWSRRSADAQDYLASIPTPTLVVNGSRDIVIPTINSFTLQQKLPDATLLLFPDSGHGVHFQYADDFVAEAVLFLDRAGTD